LNERNVAATTHGRLLIAPSASPEPAGLLVGFHGYAEAADVQFERLRAIRGSDRWRVVAVQGLHRFYQRRTNDVIASWMTRQDRELAIADNLAYVAAVVEAEWASRGGSRGVMFAGFSQGVAMAFRAAAASQLPVLGVVAAGGDVPPELEPPALTRIAHVLLCRGRRDDWYTHEKFEQDRHRLLGASVTLTPIEHEDGHDWSDAVIQAASSFLNARLS
jgi:predicted esterase